MKNIGIEYWSGRFERSPDVVKNVKLIADSLGI